MQHGAPLSPPLPAARLPVVEALQARTLLSVTPALAHRLEAAGFERLNWQGQDVYAEPGEWIVSVRGVKGSAARQLFEAGTRLRKLGIVGLRADRHLGPDGLFKVTVPQGVSADALHAAFRRVRGFEFAEPNAAVWVQGELDGGLNDPLYANQYALNNLGPGLADADIDAPEAWALAGGAQEVVVGVIDTGVEYTHPDLAPRMWVNPFETAGDGVDNDGNGFIDDVHGADFASRDGDPFDTHGHGTHVAGIIAAAADNAIGTAGVAPNAKIMALQFLSADGFGSVDSAIAALNYAISMKQRGVNVRVTNNSWGSGEFSIAIDRAIRASGDAGMVYVAAAGNGGSDEVGDDNDFEPFYPASYDAPNLISVAASDNRDAFARLSNFGPASVDLAAPGLLVVSTYKNGTWGYMSGTSMAAPHVSGAVALAFGVHPTATWQQVHAAVLGGVDAIPSMAGQTVTGGRLNAEAALLRMPLAPAVLARHVFYNHSAFDARSPADAPADHAALATDKSPLLPGQTASFANYTSYARGINGVMVDLRGPPGSLTAADFVFELRERSGAWAAAPSPASLTTRTGAGVEHATRLTLTWPDGSIRDTWLRVTLLANARTGLAQDDVFYFGNAVAETGDSATDAAVTALDVAATRAAQHAPAPIDSRYDFNRDRTINALDVAIVRGRVGAPPLPLITADPLAPLAAPTFTQSPAVPFSTTRIRPASSSVYSVGVLIGLTA